MYFDKDNKIVKCFHSKKNDNFVKQIYSELYPVSSQKTRFQYVIVIGAKIHKKTKSYL